jgi:hypothetical protein
LEHYFPFNSVNHDRRYFDEDFARYFKPILTNGVFPSPSNTLQVTADGNSMKISVQPGNGWINGRGYNNDAAWYYQLTNADGATNRIDRIVLRWSRADRSITLAVKQGTFATAPTASALQRDDDIYELALADVYVGAGVTSVTQANITDLRLNSDLCGLVCSIFTPNTTRYYDQITADLAEFKASNEADFSKWHDAKYAEFENWLSTMQDIPPADAAAYLQGQINSRAYSKLDCKKTGTVYALSGLTVASGLVPCVFKADADYNFGDTFTMDGDAITVALPDGSGLEDGFFKAGTVLTGVYDTDSKTLNFKSGGSDYDTLPAQVSNFYATRNNAKNALTWTNPDDTNFAGVLILRKTGGYPQRPSDGDRVYSGTGTTYTDTGLTNGTQYYYRAYAYNSKKQYQTLYCVATGTPSDTTAIGTLPVRSLIGFKKNDTEIPYIVVHQGLPDNYDSSCNGTWLLRKNIYMNKRIDSKQEAVYDNNPEIATFLDDTFFTFFPQNVQQKIKTVKIPGHSLSEHKVFLLGAVEIGVNYESFNIGSLEKTKLDYFNKYDINTGPSADKVALYNNNSSKWWLRTWHYVGNNAEEDTFYVTEDGEVSGTNDTTQEYGIRPAIVAANDIKVTMEPDENGYYAVME